MRPEVAERGLRSSMNMRPTHHRLSDTAAARAACPATALRRAGRRSEPQGPETLSGLGKWYVGGTEGRPVAARLNQQIFDSQI